MGQMIRKKKYHIRVTKQTGLITSKIILCEVS